MANFNLFDMVAKFKDTIEKQQKELKVFNVMIIGKTGIGKSTLINNMFNEEMTKTGIGKPITNQITKITKPDFPLAIYDTPGLELKGENALDILLDEVIAEVDNGLKSGDNNNAIHCIWYCVSTPSHRFEQAEIDFIKNFKERTSNCDIPIIMVLTKSYSKRDAEQLKSEIEKEQLDLVNIIPILAENYNIDEEYTAKAYGLDTLSTVVNSVIPEAVQKTFIAVQKVNLDLKKKRANAVVISSATATAATGAIPIAGADAPLIMAEQIKMLASITVIFGIKLDKNMITAILSTMIGVMGATYVGKTVVSNALKFIPVAGTVVGGVVSATTAAAITTALGKAYIILMTMICKGDLTVEELETETGKEKIRQVFKEQLKLRKSELNIEELEIDVDTESKTETETETGKEKIQKRFKEQFKIGKREVTVEELEIDVDTESETETETETETGKEKIQKRFKEQFKIGKHDLTVEELEIDVDTESETETETGKEKIQKRFKEQFKIGKREVTVEELEIDVDTENKTETEAGKEKIQKGFKKQFKFGKKSN